jgi:hypothetical protein
MVSRMRVVRVVREVKAGATDGTNVGEVAMGR